MPSDQPRARRAPRASFILSRVVEASRTAHRAAGRGAMSHVVTGEAVVLELRPASFGVRSLSSMIDAVVYVGLLVLTLVLLADTLGTGFDAAAAQALAVATVVFFLAVLPIGVEALTRGKSLAG